MRSLSIIPATTTALAATHHPMVTGLGSAHTATSPKPGQTSTLTIPPTLTARAATSVQMGTRVVNARIVTQPTPGRSPTPHLRPHPRRYQVPLPHLHPHRCCPRQCRTKTISILRLGLPPSQCSDASLSCHRSGGGSRGRPAQTRLNCERAVCTARLFLTTNI